jgi:hypothetical protein
MKSGTAWAQCPAPSTNDVLYSGIPTGLNIPALFKINLKISLLQPERKEKLCNSWKWVNK